MADLTLIQGGASDVDHQAQQNVGDVAQAGLPEGAMPIEEWLAMRRVGQHAEGIAAFKRCLRCSSPCAQHAYVVVILKAARELQRLLEAAATRSKPTRTVPKLQRAMLHAARELVRCD